MLVECGFVRVTTADGGEFTFRPSLGRVAALGSPQEIVALYAGLHGPAAMDAARYVLASLCDQEDSTDLTGWRDEEGWHPGLMPPAEQVIVAQHLMRHGIVGKAKPDKKGDGRYSDKFDAAEYVSAARVHLGLSSADAEALSMTEFQTMFEMKFPSAGRERDVPSREEYRAAMAAIQERRRG